MNFVLIDDVPQHNDILAAKLMQLCQRNGWNAQVAIKTTEKAQILTYAEGCSVPTVYFLDIELDSAQNTLSLSEAILNAGQECYIVYVSAHAHYAMECLHAHAFDFLLKPWTDQQLEDCLSAIMRVHRRRGASPALLVSMGSRTLQIRQEDILCFSREKMNIRMYCTDGSTLIWRESFEHLMPKLEPGYFYQCHRGHIVSLGHIRDVLWAEDRLRLQNGMTLPVSRRRAAGLRAVLNIPED